MLKKKFSLFLYVFLIIVLSACNLPAGETATEEVSDLVLTVTAQALLLQNSPTPGFTATPEFTATPGFTSTPSVPTVTVSTNTNCRTGPGTQYDLIGGLNVGQSAEVVGKSTSTGYWIIKTPGSTGTCWLWGNYATISGNTANLPEYPTPPTPTPSPTVTPTATPNPPANPSNVVAAKICIPLVLPNYQYTGTVTWQDNSNNEDGFNVYYNNALIGSVGANVTTHPIPPIVYPQGVPITLSIEAFNFGGKSNKINVIFTCP